jgi:hypothetical protein
MKFEASRVKPRDGLVAQIKSDLGKLSGPTLLFAALTLVIAMG